MLLAIDVHYTQLKDNTTAVVAGVLFDDWSDEKPMDIYLSHIDHVVEYESGQFYKRELPCILSLIKEHELKPECIVIDGYVHFGSEAQAGLGMYLYNALDKSIPIIGVAKNAFKALQNDTDIQVFRGTSAKPLYVTTVGMTQSEALAHIQSMHGDHRMPTLLKLADSLCRNPQSDI